MPCLHSKFIDALLNYYTLFRLAVVAMAGLAAEGLKYDKVIGQSADLFSLQVYSHCFPNVHSCVDFIMSQSDERRTLFYFPEIHQQKQATA